MAGIVADTHAAVWYLLNSKNLSANAQKVMDETVIPIYRRLELRPSGSELGRKIQRTFFLTRAIAPNRRIVNLVSV
jgi:hypothetical protein